MASFYVNIFVILWDGSVLLCLISCKKSSRLNNTVSVDTLLYNCHPTVICKDTSNVHKQFFAFLSYGTSGDADYYHGVHQSIYITITDSDTTIETRQSFLNSKHQFNIDKKIQNNTIIKDLLMLIQNSDPYSLRCIKGISDGVSTGGVGYVYYFQSEKDTNSVYYDFNVSKSKYENIKRLNAIFDNKDLFKYDRLEENTNWDKIFISFMDSLIYK